MMKNIIKFYFLIVLTSLIISCNHDENDIVPDFLDGTAYGVLLDVNVATENKSASVSNINDYILEFDLTYTGNKRPVTSILVNKVFVKSSTGEETAVVSQEEVTEFPKKITLPIASLINGFSNTTVSDLVSGDAIKIQFVINYEDGAVISSFDSSLRTNFTVAIVD